MKSRKFNSIMPRVNESWVSRVLGIPLNSKNGIDLYDPTKNLGVEIKFYLLPTSRHAWTVQEHQLKYERNGLTCYWGLGTYEMDGEVRRVRTDNFETLENMIRNRTLYFVRWDWMKQFPVSTVNGKSETREWEYKFCYPKLRDLPRVIKSFDVDKGVVHVTEGVDWEI